MGDMLGWFRTNVRKVASFEGAGSMTEVTATWRELKDGIRIFYLDRVFQMH